MLQFPEGLTERHGLLLASALRQGAEAQLREALSRASPQDADEEWAILEPAIGKLDKTLRDPARGGPHIVRIIARTLTEPLPFMNALLREELHAVLGRFAQILRRHVPHLTPEEFLWRLSFVIGAMQHTLATLHQMSALTHGICRDNDYEGALRRFVASAGAVFRQPVTSPGAPVPPSPAPSTPA